LGSRGFTRPDGPDRLVSDHIASRRRQRIRQLLADDGFLLAGCTLRFHFSYTNNWNQFVFLGLFGFSLYHGVRLAVILTAFGMADDHISGTNFFKHRSRDIARKRPLGFGVAVLTA